MIDVHAITIGNFIIGGNNPLVLIAGPCVIETPEKTFAIAETLCSIARDAGMPLIFKASYDKANRTSLQAFRGPGIKIGLQVLASIKKQYAVPIISDVHCRTEIDAAAAVLDIIQIPALLCRQTDLIIAAARTGKPINVKKGQFLSPRDMYHAIEKVTSTGNHDVMITERGTTFGYGNLVVDMRSLVILREFGYPVIFDATHSVQLPGGMKAASGGERNFVPALARAAVAVGVDGIFMEVHNNPDTALCDGPNSVALSMLPELLHQLRYLSEPPRKNVD
ncbi:MAG: 3-deoxy-8-phosphooctulonate synthase [Desulfobacterota bacterium]|nr:3-deoxy-8-phosphooctulonate synthase [Thermodesulfobacteriota bacterium]